MFLTEVADEAVTLLGGETQRPWLPTIRRSHDRHVCRLVRARKTQLPAVATSRVPRARAVGFRLPCDEAFAHTGGVWVTAVARSVNHLFCASPRGALAGRAHPCSRAGVCRFSAGFLRGRGRRGWRGRRGRRGG